MKIVPMSVTLVDHMGTDLSVVNAARVSFDKESEWEYNIDGRWCSNNNTLCDFDIRLSDKDKKLINYLAKHNHFTPFTHCSVTFRIKVPIFVARQLHKHQVGFTVNEVSRRYVDTEPEFFFPSVWRGRPTDGAKQGSSNESIQMVEDGDYTIEEYTKEFCSQMLGVYEELLRNKVCPEQARMVLPQNTMTEFWMTGSLFGWARVCNLRLDGHAQKEIQDVAKMISDYMKDLFPVSWKALVPQELEEERRNVD